MDYLRFGPIHNRFRVVYFHLVCTSLREFEIPRPVIDNEGSNREDGTNPIIIAFAENLSCDTSSNLVALREAC